MRARRAVLEGYRFAQAFAPSASQFISFEPMTAPVDPFRNSARRDPMGPAAADRILPAGHRRRAI